MQLNDFEKSLKQLMGNDEYLRPFICNGNPLECDAFIVGLNPATDLPNPFWTYWDTLNGFDKNKWFADYQAHRMAKPLKPGRTRRNPVSTTRRIIEKIVSGVRNHKFLETNIYTKDSSQYSELSNDDRNTQIFRFLVNVIKPKILILHGKDAHEIGKKYSEQANVWCVSHFATRDGSWSNAKTDEFIETLQSL